MHVNLPLSFPLRHALYTAPTTPHPAIAPAANSALAAAVAAAPPLPPCQTIKSTHHARHHGHTAVSTGGPAAHPHVCQTTNKAVLPAAAPGCLDVSSDERARVDCLRQVPSAAVLRLPVWRAAAADCGWVTPWVHPRGCGRGIVLCMDNHKNLEWVHNRPDLWVP